MPDVQVGGGGYEPLPTSLGDFQVISLGSGVYLLSPLEKYVTGATIEEYYRFPHPHRLLKISLKHTDNANADSTDSWSYQFRNLDINNLWNTLRAGSSLTVSDILETFDDSFRFGSTVYRLYATQTTATDRIYPSWYIEVL